ncbi:MAG: two-component system, cell cycle response regulator DivK [Acidobacteriota bacterium]|jgi:CheY-like chemotaxis protein|nr:two-component system, cell cycle response regulator DivK [Acidobacteriota bacterium]
MGVLTLNEGEKVEGGMEDKSGGQPVVLVVEDFEDNRFMMRRLLEMSGYRVVEAVNGNQAVEFAASERPDIILMDLSLPQLDGLAATRRIREQEGPRRVPIVAVSAHDSADFHSEALSAGCNEYVTKPIDFDQLVQLLDRLTAK